MKSQIIIYKRNKENPMEVFINAVRKSKSVDEAMANVRLIQQVPTYIANVFSKKYNPKHELSAKAAFIVFYNEIKQQNNEQETAC